MAILKFQLIKQVCLVFRCLILDDDVRVEFGKAHDHAKLIAVELLTDLTPLLNSMYCFFLLGNRYIQG